MGFLAVPAAIVGGVISAAGSVKGAVDNENARVTNEGIAKINAATAARAADEATKRGNAEASRLYGETVERGEQAVEAQTAAYANAGVDVSTGTPAANATSARLQAGLSAEENAATLRANAAKEAWGFRAQSSDIIRQAQMDSQLASQRTAGTLLTGFGNLVSNGAGIYDMTRPKLRS